MKKFIRHWVLLLGAVCVWYLYESIYVRNLWFFLVAGLLALLGFFFLFLLSEKSDFVDNFRLNLHPKILRIALIFSIGLLTILFFILDYHILSYGSGRMLAAVILAGLGAISFGNKGQSSTYFHFAALLLVIGSAHRVGAFFSEIQSSPFASGWSEGSRFYNASLFFSQKIYAEKLPFPVLHPSRYLIQAIPFLFDIKSILVHRIWQVVLWLGMTALGAWVLSRKLNDTFKFSHLWLFLYFVLFFFQGAVYYHLMVSVVLVLVGYQKSKPWRVLFFVLLASIWAGISRINWMPVPGLLATTLYIMDEPFNKKSWIHYLLFPFLWVVLGLLAAFATKKIYVLISGENPALFDSAFSSALLWERLLPGSTFFLGVLPAITIVCLPLAFLCWNKLRDEPKAEVHWLRLYGLAGILTVFFLGGLVVSVKIGGGGDLHNLDAFLVFYLVVCSYYLAGKIVPEGLNEGHSNQVKKDLNPFWLATAVIVVVFFAFMRSNRWSFSTDITQVKDLTELKAALHSIEDESGEVLFISERQLITFGELDEIKMVPDYEKVFLMEMAMGNNQAYLSEFYESLESHEFKAIISDPLSVNIQSKSHSFADENNAWVEKVVIPLLNAYEPVLSWRNGEVNLLVPKGEEKLVELLLESQTP